MNSLADHSVNFCRPHFEVSTLLRDRQSKPRRRLPPGLIFRHIRSQPHGQETCPKAYPNHLYYTFCTAESMACGSSCCGPPKAPQLPALPDSTTLVTEAGSDSGSCRDGADPNTGGSCQDACCDSDEPPMLNEKPGPTGCQSGCCDAEAKKPAQVAEAAVKAGAEDACCSVAADNCCSAFPPKDVNSPPDPECCDGTKVPCCDDSCLDRIALRACESGKKPVVLVESYECMFAFQLVHYAP